METPVRRAEHGGRGWESPQPLSGEERAKESSEIAGKRLGIRSIQVRWESVSLGSGLPSAAASLQLRQATTGWQDTAASLYWGTMWGSVHEARQLESSLDSHSLCPLLSPVTIDAMTAFLVLLLPVDLGLWRRGRH